MIDTHRSCGGVVEAELFYSNADNDYWFPVCRKCGTRLESLGELEAKMTEEDLKPGTQIRYQGKHLTILEKWDKVDPERGRNWGSLWIVYSTSGTTPQFITENDLLNYGSVVQPAER